MRTTHPFHFSNPTYHNHLGTPQELTDDDGNVIWANYDYAWGGSYQSYYKEQSLNGKTIDKDLLQPLKFQGQSLDIETGLHYNRFRYYDSDVGMFIQRDPIGLLGGVNVFQYAPNPIHWVDVLGLNPCNTTTTKEYDVVPYKPTNSPLENHHGVLDKWMVENIPSYGGKARPSQSPTIALSKANHDATKQVYRDWLKEKTGKPVGGKIDWKSISPREIFKLSEDMFDAAKVPKSSREKYYQELNKFLYR